MQLLVNRFAGHLVVGLEQRLFQQPADVAAADSVDHSASVPLTLHQTREPQLRQVLAGHRGAAPAVAANVVTSAPRSRIAHNSLTLVGSASNANAVTAAAT